MKNEKLKIKKLLLIGITLLTLVLPLVSLAGQYIADGKTITYEGLVPCNLTAGGDKPRCQLCHLFVMFTGLIDFLLLPPSAIVPIVAALMLTIGGFMYIFAYVSPSEILPGGQKGGPALLSQAKKLISSVIFGLLIIYAGWIIVNTFFQAIGVAEWTGLKNWWQRKCEITLVELPPLKECSPPCPAGYECKDGVCRSIYGSGPAGTVYEWAEVPSGKYCKDVKGEGWITYDPSNCPGASPGLNYECCGKPPAEFEKECAKKCSGQGYTFDPISKECKCTGTETHLECVGEDVLGQPGKKAYYCREIPGAGKNTCAKKGESCLPPEGGCGPNNEGGCIYGLSCPAGFKPITGNCPPDQVCCKSEITLGTCFGVECPDSPPIVNFCGPMSANCYEAKVKRWDQQIQVAAKGKTICPGIDTVTLVKAIMSQESNGEIDIGSADGKSAGLMQLTIDTAKKFQNQCGAVGETITFSWLKNSANAQKQICMAIEYLKTLVGPCGCDIRHLAAGYNGGGGRGGRSDPCLESANCGSAAKTDGGECIVCPGESKTLKWECLWDDNKHTKCNAHRPEGSFAPTRKYVPKVLYCYNQF